jgi:anti-sigma B factor antagonist
MPPPQQDDATTLDGGQEPGTVEVGHHAAGIAVVTMYGEHDISTEPLLVRALEEAAAHSSVVVDLSECSFIDSTVIAALIRGAKSTHARGDRFALVIPPEQRHVARIAQMVRLGELLSLHDSREAALAAFG